MVVQIGDEVRVVGLCGAHKSGANGANGVIVAWRDGEGRVRMTTGSLRDQVIDVSGHNLQRPSHHTMRNMMMHNMLHGSGAPGASSVYPASKGMAIGGRGGVGSRASPFPPRAYRGWRRRLLPGRAVCWRRRLLFFFF